MFLVVFPTQPSAPIDVGGMLDQTLRELGMDHKEAWIQMRYRDGSQFSRALKGEHGYPLDLWKLALLPWRVQATFWSKYIAAQAARLTDDLKADRLRMVRLDETRKEKVG